MIYLHSENSLIFVVFIKTEIAVHTALQIVCSALKFTVKTLIAIKIDNGKLSCGVGDPRSQRYRFKPLFGAYRPH